MPDIQDAIERVKIAETSAAETLARARREASLILRRAEEEGRRQHDAILKDAQDAALRIVEEGRAGAVKLRSSIETEAEEARGRIAARVAGNLDSAVSLLIDLYRKENPTGGGRAEARRR